MSEPLPIPSDASADPAPRSFDGRCPLCHGALYRLDVVLFCPDEDAHTGGLIVYDDGSYRRMERVLSTRGTPIDNAV